MGTLTQGQRVCHIHYIIILYILGTEMRINTCMYKANHILVISPAATLIVIYMQKITINRGLVQSQHKEGGR